MMSQTSLKRDYDFSEEIGRGKLGTVFKCRSCSTADSFAVKFIDKRSRKEWKEEAKILHHLSPHPHPHIIHLDNLWEDETHLHMVIDYCPNGDLFNFIVTNQIILSENQARCLFNQSMQAISNCHEYRVVHRDINPETVSNCFVGVMISYPPFILVLPLFLPETKRVLSRNNTNSVQIMGPNRTIANRYPAQCAAVT